MIPAAHVDLAVRPNERHGVLMADARPALPRAAPLPRVEAEENPLEVRIDPVRDLEREGRERARLRMDAAARRMRSAADDAVVAGFRDGREIRVLEAAAAFGELPFQHVFPRDARIVEPLDAERLVRCAAFRLRLPEIRPCGRIPSSLRKINDQRQQRTSEQIHPRFLSVTLPILSHN